MSFNKTDYMKEYYNKNKHKIIRQVVERAKLVTNSEKYIEANRGKIIDDLNSGKRKYVQMTTLKKYGINIDPNTMKYYYDTNNFHYKHIYNEHCQEATSDTVNQSASGSLYETQNVLIMPGDLQTGKPLYDTPKVLNMISDAPTSEPVYESTRNKPNEIDNGDEAEEAFDGDDNQTVIDILGKVQLSEYNKAFLSYYCIRYKKNKNRKKRNLLQQIKERLTLFN